MTSNVVKRSVRQAKREERHASRHYSWLYSKTHNPLFRHIGKQERHHLGEISRVYRRMIA
jgi:rubrerythrin